MLIKEGIRIENEELSEIFFALSDKNRRCIVSLLVSEDLSVGAISRTINKSLALTSKHLKVLVRSGLIEQFKLGRNTICKIKFGKLTNANVWLSSLGLIDVLDVSSLESFLSDQNVI